MHGFLRPLESFVSNDIGMDSDLVENLFDLLKGYVLDANWFVDTLGGYDPSIDPYDAYLLDFPRKIMWATFLITFFYFSKT